MIKGTSRRKKKNIPLVSKVFVSHGAIIHFKFIPFLYLPYLSLCCSFLPPLIFRTDPVRVILHPPPRQPTSSYTVVLLLSYVLIHLASFSVGVLARSLNLPHTHTSPRRKPIPYWSERRVMEAFTSLQLFSSALCNGS